MDAVSALKCMFGECKAGNYTKLRNWVYLLPVNAAHLSCIGGFPYMSPKTQHFNIQLYSRDGV